MLFVLVGDGRVSQSRHMSQIDHVVEDAGDRAAAPMVGPGSIQMSVGCTIFPVIIVRAILKINNNQKNETNQHSRQEKPGRRQREKRHQDRLWFGHEAFSK